MKHAILTLFLIAAVIHLTAFSNTTMPKMPNLPGQHPYPPFSTEPQDADRTWLITQSTHYSFSGVWDPEDLEEYSYDQFNRLLQYTVKTWNSGGWLLVNLKDYIYNSEGLLAKTIQRGFDGYEWQDSQKVSYEYDTVGRKTLMVVSARYNNGWVEWYRHVYTYNTAGLLATDNTYHNYQGVSFETDLKTFSYNAAGQLTELFERSITGDWEWVFDSRTLYTYGQDGLLALALYQQPDGFYNWQDHSRNMYYYNGSGLLTEDACQSYYATTGWQNWFRRLYGYDANGLQTEQQYQEFDQEWLSVNRQLYMRDTHGNDTEILDQRWVDSAWNDRNKWLRTFSSTALEDDLTPAAELLLSCHPNPFGNSTDISFELKSPAQVHLDVFNLRGQKLCTLHSGIYASGKHSASWDGRDNSGNPVPAGIYLVRLHTPGQGTALRKISKY